MLNFSKFPNYKDFEHLALGYLLGAVERFFGGTVKYDANPVEFLKSEYGIDVAEFPDRGSYVLDDSTAIILGRVRENETVQAVFALYLKETNFNDLAHLLQQFEANLAITLSRSCLKKFKEKPHQFGDELIELVISKYFSGGYFDYRVFQHLIDTFHKLSNIKFEGRNFTTGLILTKSFHEYAKKGSHDRKGELFTLSKDQKIKPKRDIDKRFWYLADGQTSYYMCTDRLEISNFFVLGESGQRLKSFVDDYSLSKTIKGGDALFRVTSQSEFSILGSDGVEFNYKEGHWRVRNLEQISNVIQNALGVDTSFVHSFLYYVFYLSRSRLSSILWVPKNTSIYQNLLIPGNNQDNKFTETPLSIHDETHTQSLLRLLSSDGTSIIGLDGRLISYGAVVNTSGVSFTGLKGTGEAVAAMLGQSNGLSVKVSQDGAIKIFIQTSRLAIII